MPRPPVFHNPMLLTSRHYPLLCRMALFAMLMLFVGPMISQTQQLMAETIPDAAHQQHAGHQHPAAHQHQSPLNERLVADLANINSHHDLSACGYCTLGIHLPGLSMVVTLPATLPPTTHSPWNVQSQQAGATPVHLRPGPRAPPASLPIPV